MKLLIVDDNPRMRATIRSVVTPAAAEIVECDNGLDAVALYDARRPDWVLMDISMPALDGIRATRRIRAINPAARVVIVTDFVDQAFRQAAAGAGAVAFVTKDNLLELLRIIE